MKPQVKIMRASAGSGKTYRLSYEYVRHVIDNPQLYRHILAVTFTNKATEEMKNRILSDLHEISCEEGHHAFLADLQNDLGLQPWVIRQRAKDALSRILHDYSRFSVQTIDKFFQRIVRGFIRELGIEMDYTIDFDHTALLELAVDRLMDETSHNEGLRNSVRQFVRKSVGEGKNWDVRREMIQLGRAVFNESFDDRYFEANREVVRQFYEVLSAESTKARKLMRDKAKEAVALITSNGLTALDFYYGASGFASYFYKMAAGQYEGYGTRVAAALEEGSKWNGKKAELQPVIETLRVQLQPLLREICRCWDENRLLIRTEMLCRKTFHSFRLLGDIHRQVRKITRERNIMLLAQTNAMIQQLIEGNDAPFIYEKTGNTFSHFMIDEFQDTSSKQWQNFLPLIRNALAQTESPLENVLLVGDVKQSIYRWRGGDWMILQSEAEKEIGPEKVYSEPLKVNWRSKRNIVRFNNALIRSCIEIGSNQLNEELSEALQKGIVQPATNTALCDILRRAYTDMEQQPAPKNDIDEGFARIVLYQGDENETRLIETIKQLQDRGYRASDIAILTRTNRSATRYANVLLSCKSQKEHAPYCFDVVSQEALLVGNSALVRFAAACLGLAVDPQDAVCRLTFNDYMGQSPEKALTYSQHFFFESLRASSLQEAFEKIVYTFSLGETAEQLPYLQAFHDTVIAFSGKNTPDLSLFMRWWNEKGAEQKMYLPSQQNAIRILTIHKSKGLQFKAVIIPECQWSLHPQPGSLIWAGSRWPEIDSGNMLLPYEDSMDASLYADDYYTEKVFSHVDGLNMLYVVLTRAEEELHVMIPAGSGSRNIARLVEQSLRTASDDPSRAVIPAAGASDDGTEQGITGEFSQTGIFSFGACRSVKTARSDDGAQVPVFVDKYACHDFEPRLRTRLRTARFFAEEEDLFTTVSADGPGSDPSTSSLSPRQRGVLLHRIFSQLQNRSDVRPMLEKMVFDGEISSHEKTSIEAFISKALDDPLIGSWFEPHWRVYNEQDIILPKTEGENAPLHTAGIRRPDRVIVHQGRAVVIDYKFGYKENKAYIEQLKNYVGLLRQMGYADVKGYIWYVQLNNLCEVDETVHANQT